METQTVLTGVIGLDVFDAVESRRSIRKFNKQQVSRELVEKLLEMAVYAPSPKNIQNWRYVVVNGADKLKLFNIVLQAIAEKKSQGMITASGVNSVKTIAHASAVILVFNADYRFEGIKDLNDRFMWLAEVQAIGAAVENLLLTATKLGIGTLWICDVLYAADKINDWLQTGYELMAAVALGYFDKAPEAAGRRPLNEVVEWIFEDVGNQ